jgi:hypothetical protein
MDPNSCGNSCNHHGSCISESCFCDLGWFSSNSTLPCADSGIEYWGKAWNFLIIFFNILFSFIFLFSSFKLYKSLKQEKTYDCANKLMRTIKSPKNLSLLGIIVMSFIRVVWLSFDPLVFDNRSNRMTDRLLFETVYPLTFTVLASVLLVWYLL